MELFRIVNAGNRLDIQLPLISSFIPAHFVHVYFLFLLISYMYIYKFLSSYLRIFLYFLHMFEVIHMHTFLDLSGALNVMMRDFLCIGKPLEAILSLKLMTSLDFEV